MADEKTTVRTTRSKTTTEITIEKDEFTVIRAMRTQNGWCHRCSAATSLITTEDAAAASRVSVSVIYQWAEMGRLHFADAGAGQSLVCFGSLRTSD